VGASLHRNAAAIGLALAAALVLAACAPGPEPPGPRLTGAGPSTIEAGRAIFNFRCYFCHGYSGDARTVAATFLTPAPRDFTTGLGLGRNEIAHAVREGRSGTAMPSFASVLRAEEIEAVAAFVEHELVRTKARNSAYHTAANGWPDHARYASAFPFARGELSAWTPPERLDAGQKRGRQLYVAACVSCHDRGPAPGATDLAWEARPLSAPRSEYTGDPAGQPEEDDFGPYRIHDTPPTLARASRREARGAAVYRDNCALCHAADGTGRNWIGSFLEPHPPDLTAPDHASRLEHRALVRTLSEGIPGSSMPAFGSVLSDTDLEAVAAYVRRAFGRPRSPAA
jgi:cytochrome c oxidase cbb3-type subunit III